MQTIKRSLIEKETYEGESEDRKRANKAKWEQVKNEGNWSDLPKKSSHRQSYVEHMDGFNPVTVRLMSCTASSDFPLFRLRQTSSVCSDDGRKSEKEAHHPTLPLPPTSLSSSTASTTSYSPCTCCKFAADPMSVCFRRLCSHQRDVQQVPQLHHQRRHGPGAGVHHRSWIRAQVSWIQSICFTTEEESENCNWSKL